MLMFYQYVMFQLIKTTSNALNLKSVTIEREFNIFDNTWFDCQHRRVNTVLVEVTHNLNLAAKNGWTCSIWKHLNRTSM